MKIKITFNTNNKIIPFEYKGYLQGAIYKCFDEEMGTFIHDSGVTYEDKSFKMFTYSELLGKFNVVKGRGLKFEDEATFYVTSIFKEIIDSVYEYYLQDDILVLGHNGFNIKSVELIEDYFNEQETYTIRTLSPIITYKTDKKNYRTFFNPQSEDFETALRNNLERKYMSLYEEEPDNEYFEVIKATNIRKQVAKYKTSVFDSFHCELEIRCSYRYLQLLVLTGAGSKNSAGFGMIEIKD